MRPAKHNVYDTLFAATAVGPQSAHDFAI